MNNMFDEVELKYRCTGRTTRLVDGYVQKLFENLKNSPDKWITIVDHTGIMSCSFDIINKIIRRLEFEHNIYCQVQGDKIKISPEYRERVFRHNLKNVQ